MVGSYLVTFLGSFLAALVATPAVARLARSMRIVDRPGTRKVHATAVPRIGGLAVVTAAVATSLAAFFIEPRLAHHFGLLDKQLYVLLGASGFVFLVGFVDDSIGVAARTKLLAQLLAAGVVCAMGIRIDKIQFVEWPMHLGWASWPVTLIWIVGITNAVNLIDGLDGLASGICAITCAVIAVFALYGGQVVMAVLMLTLLGSLLGFLVFNFNPARIFLGDCGSMFLGFYLAVSSVICMAKSSTFVGLALPALALGLPIFDTLFSIVRRALERRSMFAPDRNHLHHRLMNMGLRHGHAVVVMYVVTLLGAGLGMLMMVARGSSSLAVLVAALVPFMVIFRVAGAVRFREAMRAFLRNVAIARETRKHQQGFEEMQLRLREARTTKQSWRALRRAAREMGLSRMSVELRATRESRLKLLWRLPVRDGEESDLLQATINIAALGADNPMRVEVDVPVDGSLESAARRLALFCRLVEEYQLPEDPRRTGDADDEVPAGNAASPAAGRYESDSIAVRSE
mgnify:CR=1 FL=1